MVFGGSCSTSGGGGGDGVTGEKATTFSTAHHNVMSCPNAYLPKTRKLLPLQKTDGRTATV